MKFKLQIILFLLFIVALTSCHKRVAYNPYLKMNVKPSVASQREYTKAHAEYKKEFVKQTERNKKEVQGRVNDFFKKKKQYGILKRGRKKKQKGRF